MVLLLVCSHGNKAQGVQCLPDSFHDVGVSSSATEPHHDKGSLIGVWVIPSKSLQAFRHFDWNALDSRPFASLFWCLGLPEPLFLALRQERSTATGGASKLEPILVTENLKVPIDFINRQAKRIGNLAIPRVSI